MKNSEIQMFKQFLSDKKISQVFAETYKKNHLMTNPASLDEYLEKTRAENVIPQAFSYPNNYFGKQFWLGVNEEWTQIISHQKAVNREAIQLDCLDLEVIDMKEVLKRFRPDMKLFP